jgi:hypothetical protein
MKCSSCGGEDHTSTRSPKCPDHKPNKKEQIEQLIGNSKTVTRKIKLDSILKEDYKNIVKDKVVKIIEDIRNIIIRCQIFVNYYIICHSDEGVDNSFFKHQNCWYSISQLVIGKMPKNIKGLPQDLLESWRSFSGRYPKICYNMEYPIPGYSHCLTAACVELGTIYTNMVAENFESRLTRYLIRSMKPLFDNVSYLSGCI